MGLFDRIRRFFRRRTPTVTRTEIKPTTASVKVTDFTSGESVKTTTTTSPSGVSRTTRTASGGGGSSVSPARETQLIQATEDLEKLRIDDKIEQAKKDELSPTEQKKLETQLKTIQEKVEKEPLGKVPDPKKEPSRLKRFSRVAGDIFTGSTFGLLTPFASTSFIPTAKEPAEVRKEVGDVPKKALLKTKIFSPLQFGGLSFGRLPSGRIGVVGYSDLGTALASEQTILAKNFREESARTLNAQQKQVEQINKTVTNIEREQGKLSDTTQFLKDLDKFSRDVTKFEQQAKSVTPDKITGLEQERKGLLRQQESLSRQQKQLSAQQTKFEEFAVTELKGLRKIGVEPKFTKAGDIEFTSKSLEKRIAPVGIKLQKDLLKQDGKLSAKNIALGSTALAREVGIAYGVGVATGGLGFVAGLGQKIARLPKAIQLAVKGTAVGLAGLGVGLSTYRGFKLGEIEGIGKIGGTISGLKTAGQIGGFGVGAFKGTKVHLQKIEADIISGKTTKSIADIKTGATFGRGGLAKQLSKFETRVTGTKMKITSLAEIKSTFATKQGVSDIAIITKIAKAPKGVPAKVITKGQSLETPELIKARLFTQVPKIKGLTKQDILISRKVLDQKTVSVAGKPFFEPFVKLQKANILAGIKTVGEPVKVKAFPKDVFTSGERYLFKVTGKVAGVGEFAEARADSIFKSKQFILTTKTFKVGDVKIKKFTTVATTKGLSADLLKDVLKTKLLVLDLKTKQLSAVSILPSGKRGQVLLGTAPKTFTQPVPQIKLPKLTKGFAPTIDTRTLLKVQLQKIVPQILAKQSALISPTIPSISLGGLGLKEVLRLRVQTIQVVNLKSLTKLKLDMSTKFAQINISKVAQVPALKLAQIPRIELFTLPVTKTAMITTPPKVVVPAIPPLPLIDIGGRPRRRKKGRGARTQNILTGSESFTAKQIDLAPVVLTPAQARKILSVKLTGLGIRRGIIVK